MTKIKICGLTRPEDIEIVNSAVPDYVGFVFAESRRKVSASIALELKKSLHPEILAVGVFVNEEIDHIIKLCETGTIDLIQLHGEEDEEFIKKLKSKVSAIIIKAVRVQRAEDIMKASELSCDYLLLDTYQKGMYGGSGRSFDWSMITKQSSITEQTSITEQSMIAEQSLIPGQKQYFLAGGINSENISEALQLQPYAVDISSGVETDGKKDAHKIQDIIKKIRSVR